MISADFQTILHGLSLSLVAGTPLLMAALCCTPFIQAVTRFLPWAAVPALLAAVTAPLDVIVEVPWFFMGGRMGLDATGRIFLCLAAFIWFLGCFSSRILLKDDKDQARFLVFFLTAMAGNFGLILARGMLGFYLFFAVMSFAAYGLVVHKGSDEAAKAGRIYLTLLMIGEVALCTALIIMAHNIGSLALEDIGGISQPLILGLLFIGFGVKTGALPVHGWMVPAYQAAPIPAAAVLAGSMVNAGILGWLRFLPPDQTSCPQGAVLFIAAGALAAVYGVIIGLNRKQPGEILGCSSISQRGLITVSFGLGRLATETGLDPVPVLILYVVHHSLAKSSLFFGYDLVERQGTIMSRLQLTALLLPAMALAGLPLSSGAVAKTAFKELTVTLGAPWSNLSIVFLPITAIGTTLLMLHFICVLNRPEKTDNPGKTESAITFSISFLATAITLWLWPAARNPASHSLETIKLVQALWPIAGGCLLFFSWRRFFSSQKNPADDPEKQTAFESILHTLTGLIQKKWRTSQQDRLAPYLSRLIPQLRRSEKITGRWKVAGLSYLALSLYLLFLLL